MLPVPDKRAVEEFRDLYKRRFDMELTDEQAYDVARKVIGIVYVQDHFFPIHPDLVDQPDSNLLPES